MKTYRNNLLAKLHILLQQQGVDADTKADIYASYGVTTAADMTDSQLSHLVGRLENRDMGQTYAIPPRADVTPETRRLRSQCLKLITGSPSPANPRQRGLGLPNDWAVINPFVQHHTGAMLNQLSDGSLINFVKKLRKIRDSGWFYRAPQPVKTQEATPMMFMATSRETVVS